MPEDGDGWNGEGGQNGEKGRKMEVAVLRCPFGYYLLDLVLVLLFVASVVAVYISIPCCFSHVYTSLIFSSLAIFCCLFPERIYGYHALFLFFMACLIFRVWVLRCVGSGGSSGLRGGWGAEGGRFSGWCCGGERRGQ